MSMQAVFEYIQANYKTTSLGEIAEVFHYDTAYLGKLIKANFGRGFTDIVRELRVTEAKRLLCTTKMSVGRVAEQVGYHNQVHFFRQFRVEVGTTPGTYRQEQNNRWGEEQSKRNLDD